MKNYKSSDYALNKYSDGIVYRFADGSAVTITAESYLAENPGKTEADFQALKELSDAIYLGQDRADNAQTKKNTPLYSEEAATELSALSLEDLLIEVREREEAAAAFERLMESGVLTETQKRRFRLNIVDGLSHRQIAAAEGVAVRAVTQSIHAATEKLRKIFNFF